jgi:hypothetical protein
LHHFLAALCAGGYARRLMKSLSLLLAALILSCMIMTANAAEHLYHVVSFKFKSTATPEQIKEVEQAFANLKKKIPTIVSLDWGTNVSKEKHDKGFTHCFVLTFKSEKDRDDYIVDSAHKAFGTIVGPVLEDVYVIDFWSKK